MISIVQRCPPEILSAICEIIADDDERNTFETQETKFKTLKTLSRACRAFLPHCRRFIFRTISIYDHYNPNNRTSEFFTRLVEGTPEIAEFVQTLGYGMRLQDDVHFAGVTAVLDKLTSVKSLALSIHSYKRDWTDIPLSTGSSLLKLIRSPNLVSLELRSIRNLDLGVFLPCPNLHSLYLHTVTFYDDTKGDVKDSVSVVTFDCLRLKKLRLENTPDYEDDEGDPEDKLEDETEIAQPKVDFSGIKSVSFLISKKHQVTLAKNILSKAPLVKSIEITGEDHELVASSAAAIAESGSALSALKSLTFNAYPVNSDDCVSTHPLPGICEALSRMAGKAKCLEFINVHIFLFTRTFIESNKWRDLERALLTSQWPSLRHVQLHITSYLIVKAVIEQLEALRHTQFALLSSGQQNFTFGFSVSAP